MSYNDVRNLIDGAPPPSPDPPLPPPQIEIEEAFADEDFLVKAVQNLRRLFRARGTAAGIPVEQDEFVPEIVKALERALRSVLADRLQGRDDAHMRRVVSNTGTILCHTSPVERFFSLRLRKLAKDATDVQETFITRPRGTGNYRLSTPLPNNTVFEQLMCDSLLNPAIF
jgi:hypothetical protein